MRRHEHDRLHGIIAMVLAPLPSSSRQVKPARIPNRWDCPAEPEGGKYPPHQRHQRAFIGNDEMEVSMAEDEIGNFIGSDKVAGTPVLGRMASVPGVSSVS
jgi:hypothetical protein